MDQACLVDIFDRCEHLKEEIDGIDALELPWVTFLEGSQVLALELHYDEILLACFLLVNEVMHLNDTLEASQLRQELILRFENFACLVLLFHLQRHFDVSKTV